MSLKSSVERSRRKRTFSREAGVGEKRVLVRTEDDARELDALLKKQLATFVDRQLTAADEQNRFSPQVREALEQALLLKGDRGYITPHGAFSTMLTEMLNEGLTEELAPAVAVYTAVYPSSVDYVLKSIPAKVLNFLCRHFNSQAVIRWTEENPDWQETIKGSLKLGTFSQLIRQIRQAIGEANIPYRMLKMLAQLRLDAGELSPHDADTTRLILERAPDTLLLSPREWSEDTNRLRACILFFILNDLEARYGEMACRDRICEIPFYSREMHNAGMDGSRIITLDGATALGRKYDYGLSIGWRYDSWEQFFYQLCHQAVHLLNPTAVPHDEMKICALEEGVAICYAETMREKYLPHVGRAFLDSPVGLRSSCHEVWNAVMKLPDEVLYQIRKEFGSFGSITDPARFRDITARWLTQEEAALLCDQVRY